MNRIDRLFAITTRLQSRGRVRAIDLAEHFEVSLRTIYRNIAALSESGVPIVSLPGQGYALADGYFLPPLHFSADEAIALVLGARLLSGSAAPDLGNAAQEAAAKILAIIDDTSHRRLEEIEGAIDVMTFPDAAARIDLGNETIDALRRAILERHVVALRYFGRNRGELTVRNIELTRLTYVNGAWHLTAYCQTRRAERAFRLDRIEAFAVQTTRFRARAATVAAEPPRTEVVVRFSPPTSRWAQEQQHWSFVAAAQRGESLIATYRPGNIEEIANWILGWGSSAEVLSPPRASRAPA